MVLLRTIPIDPVGCVPLSLPRWCTKMEPPKNDGCSSSSSNFFLSQGLFSGSMLLFRSVQFLDDKQIFKKVLRLVSLFGR